MDLSNTLPGGVLPYDLVRQHYTLPFDLYEFQASNANNLAPFSRQGYWAEVGTGKTAMSTVSALYRLLTKQSDQFLINVPPILIRQWVRWLEKTKGITALAYRGTPKERQALQLDADFLVMSMQIFKKDIERLDKDLTGRKVGGIVDEATSIKNIETSNYQSVRDFFAGSDLMLLSGTPLTTPEDAYAYIKLISPTVYRSKRQFDNIHIEERDFYGKPTRWARLDLLTQNFHIQSCRILKREVLKDLPPVTYDPIHYDLEPAHAKIYRQLAESQLLELEGGGKVDLTTENHIYQKLQQAVMGPGFFTGDPSMRPTGLDLVDEVLSELNAARQDGKKLLLGTWYKRTSAMLADYLNKESTTWRGYPGAAVSIVGGITERQRDLAVQRFIEDPRCRIMIMQPGAGGKGTDGLQHVCSDALFVEIPPTAIDFQQTVGRLDRGGQTEPVTVRAAIAEGTVQYKLWLDALNKEALANKVQLSYQDLRDAVYGMKRGHPD